MPIDSARFATLYWPISGLATTAISPVGVATRAVMPRTLESFATTRMSASSPFAETASTRPRACAPMPRPSGSSMLTTAMPSARKWRANSSRFASRYASIVP